MFNSPALEVAIGLIFCFASVALMASAANEAVAALFGLRAKTLLGGVKQLLNDPGFDGLALAVYNHALVHPRGSGTIPAGASARQIPDPPSYIDAMNFANALLECLQQLEDRGAALEARLPSLAGRIAGLPDAQLRALLLGMLQRADGDLATFQAAIADWFDHGMDRVSGLYKRHAQAITFLLGLLLAAAMNIDAVHLFQALWQQPGQIALIEQLPLADGGPPPDMLASLQRLQQLPIGRSYFGLDAATLAADLFGVLITASAAMFGAPFWFDLLQGLVQLRSTGPKPDRQGKSPP